MASSNFSHFIDEWPIAEILILFVLLLITLNRKRLSSNDEYRRKPKGYDEPIVSVVPKKVYQADYSKAGAIAFSKFTPEVTIHVLSYLNNHEIGSLMGTSKTLHKELSSDFIWEQLWIQTYGEMWQDPVIKAIREGRGIYWDPMLNFGTPHNGWYRFFFLFEVTWMDWILAGYCNESRCLLGIDTTIVDCTAFIPAHPGSSETLTDGAGCDATEAFAEIGHTTYAESLKKSMTIWDFDALGKNSVVILKNGASMKFGRRRPVRRTKLQQHMKSTQKKIVALAEMKHDEEPVFTVANMLDLASSAGAAAGNAAHSAANTAVNAAHSAANSAVSAAGAAVNIVVQNAPAVPKMPDITSQLPTAIVQAASGVLGQADNLPRPGEVVDTVEDAPLTSMYDDDTVDEAPAVEFLPILKAAASHSVRGVSNSVRGAISLPSKGLTSLFDRIKVEFSLDEFDDDSDDEGGIANEFLDDDDEEDEVLRAKSSDPLIVSDLIGVNKGKKHVKSEQIAAYFAPSHALTHLKQRCICHVVQNQGEDGEAEQGNGDEGEAGGEGEEVPADGAPAAPNAVIFGPSGHVGHPKAYFDPLAEEWTAWWSCCGQGQILVEPPLPAPLAAAAHEEDDDEGNGGSGRRNRRGKRKKNNSSWW